jgi:hypothetical protein
MRLMASWQQYLATADESGVQIHQYAGAEVTADVAGDRVRLDVATNYPWSGRIVARVVETPARAWTLSLRIPEWCRAPRLLGPDGAERVPAGAGYAELARQWRPGDEVVLELGLTVRVTEPHPDVDAIRGCVAIERGPLVYCVESADIPASTVLEELEWDGSRHLGEVARPDLGDAVTGITVPLARRADRSESTVVGAGAGLAVAAIPYYAWANRTLGGMRVWIPTPIPRPRPADAG